MKYYSTQHPIAPGTFPKPDGNKVIEIVNFDKRQYERQDRSYHRVPLIHGFPLVSIQIVNTHHDNPSDLGQIIVGTLGVGFQSYQLYPQGHRPLDTVDDKNPVTLYFQHSDDVLTRLEQIIFLHQ